jgi:hypothetical protein
MNKSKTSTAATTYENTNERTISIMAKHSQLHSVSQQATDRPTTKAEVAASHNSDLETTSSTHVVINMNNITNHSNISTNLENIFLAQPSVLPIAVQAFDPEEDLEKGERTIRIPPPTLREPTRSKTDRDNVPIAIAVPMAAPLDEGEAFEESTKSPADNTLPPTTAITTPKPSPPSSMWSLEESSPPLFRWTLAAMCGLTILLAWAVIAIIVSKGIQHHHLDDCW